MPEQDHYSLFVQEQEKNISNFHIKKDKYLPKRSGGMFVHKKVITI